MVRGLDGTVAPFAGCRDRGGGVCANSKHLPAEAGFHHFYPGFLIGGDGVVLPDMATATQRPDSVQVVGVGSVV